MTELEAILEIDELVVDAEAGEHRKRYSYRFLLEGLMIFTVEPV